MQELFDRKFISAIKSLNVEDAPLARRMIKGRLHIFAILLKQFSLKNVLSSGSGSVVALTANDSFIRTKM